MAVALLKQHVIGIYFGFRLSQPSRFSRLTYIDNTTCLALALQQWTHSHTETISLAMLRTGLVAARRSAIAGPSSLVPLTRALSSSPLILRQPDRRKSTVSQPHYAIPEASISPRTLLG
jgi:hypothetical protein